MKMYYQFMRAVIATLVSINFLLAQQSSDLPFQVLVAKNATIHGEEVKALKYVDDVTSIEVGEGGFLSLVHAGGTTYEMRERIFTFYLKPEELKERKIRPPLELLYMDSVVLDQTKLITVLYPPFDRSGYLVWDENEPFNVFWHLHDEPIINYILSVSDGNGNKIQDFRTKRHEYELKPTTYGLQTPTFIFKLSSTFAGETIESKTYTIELKSAPPYEKKAADVVLKALDLELSPTLALKAWQEVLGLPNANEYSDLYEKFLKRNSSILTAAGEDVQQLLSQNK
ncbi:MAG: hypothetical protein AAF391_11490 [Bacteroidota bacterium]